ncbi:MAG: hypothetical protein Q9161_002682 [Pseudevernia consocians]
MDELLPQLLSFPPHPEPTKSLSDSEYDKHIKNLVHHINTVPASKLTSGVPGGGDLLDIIDPSKNTLPYLYTLLAHICGSGGKQKAGSISDSFSPGSALWQKMLEFVERFDKRQIRYAGTELRRLLDITATKAKRVSQPWAAIPSIRSAILRVDESGSTFTSSHTTFAHLCLETRAYTAALPILDRNIFHFPSTTNKSAENSMFPYLSSHHDTSSTFITPDSGLSAKLEYRDHLMYFLYGAMIYMGLKKWKRALLFLEIVIMSPVVNNVSMIQVDAYKKWVLVSLLYHGHPLHLPKTISQQASKQYHAICKAYDGLAEVFKDGILNEESDQRLIAEATAGEAWWAPDFNRSLIVQVINAFRQFSVLQLGKTFAALTVADIARRTSPDPNDYAGTGEYVIHLISSGVLNATISQPSTDPASWILRFSDSTSGPLSRTEEEQHQHLEKQTRKIKSLMEHIREADRKLSLNKDYIAEAKKAKKTRLNDVEGGMEENAWMTQGDAYEHDEDMMADL